MGAAVLLLFQEFGLEHFRLGALAGEEIVIAAIKLQSGAIEMDDMVADLVQQVAVMADDHDGRRITGEIIDQPQRPFEVEIVGRLVEQQQVRLRKQHRSEGDAHPPAAGKLF